MPVYPVGMLAMAEYEWLYGLDVIDTLPGPKAGVWFPAIERIKYSAFEQSIVFNDHRLSWTEVIEQS